MKLPSLLALALASSANAASACLAPTTLTTTTSPSSSATSRPLNLPFHASGSQILDTSNQQVRYAGANWAGHLEAMIPEGLQYASISAIVGRLKGFGLNSVRLTYATQMVDEIYAANGSDATLASTLATALGATNGSRILSQILSHNPQFTPATTRLQVFDAVARELAAQNVILHLDNQVSSAVWCCLPGDGNGWFGEGAFVVQNWVRGWAYMASHGRANWPSFASVGLRNELRLPLFHPEAEPYDWYTWYARMTEAAGAVHSANPDLLIFFGGLDSDTDDSPLPYNNTLFGTVGTASAFKTAHFEPSKLPYGNKMVLEIHKYDDFITPTKEPCDQFYREEYARGFAAVNDSDPATKVHIPLVMTEFGFSQDASTYQNQYPQCLTQMVQRLRFGWMQWALQGGYYIRQGTQDYDEGWGLLNHYWNDTRSVAAVRNVTDRMIAAVK